MVLGRRLARSGFCFCKVTLAAVWRIDYKGGKSRDKKSRTDRKGAGRDVPGPVSRAPREQAGEVASATEEGGSPGGLAGPGEPPARGGAGLAGFGASGVEGTGGTGRAPQGHAACCVFLGAGVSCGLKGHGSVCEGTGQNWLHGAVRHGFPSSELFPCCPL